MADKSISEIPTETDMVYRTNMFAVMYQSGDFDNKKGTAYYGNSCETRTNKTVDLDEVADGLIDKSYKFIHWVEN